MYFNFVGNSLLINISCSSLNVDALNRLVIWELRSLMIFSLFLKFGCDVSLYNDHGIMSLVRWSLETRCPVWTTRGGALAAGGESQWAGAGFGKGRV